MDGDVGGGLRFLKEKWDGETGGGSGGDEIRRIIMSVR